MKLSSIIFLALVAYILNANGFASRYWDCCKPSCSWTANCNNPARSCDRNMNRIWDTNARSKCDGGPSTTCLDQIPMVVNSNLAYAFAASPGNGPNVCGKCFELTFDGRGKYETKLNHKKLQGKKLIVMTSNIGYDVNGGQFDIMIPGGGVGYFNGCSDLFGNNLGAQYGGLLSDCENSVGWGGSDEDIYKKRKDCLSRQCSNVFQKNSKAKEGCLFLANWMEAAGNPTHTYKEVSCPQALKDKW